LPIGASHADALALFAGFDVVDIVVYARSDRHVSAPPGTGFIAFRTAAEAQRALQALRTHLALTESTEEAMRILRLELLAPPPPARAAAILPASSRQGVVDQAELNTESERAQVATALAARLEQLRSRIEESLRRNDADLSDRERRLAEREVDVAARERRVAKRELLLSRS